VFNVRKLLNKKILFSYCIRKSDKESLKIKKSFDKAPEQENMLVIGLLIYTPKIYGLTVAHIQSLL